LQEIFLANRLEPCRRDFSNGDLLAGSNMAQNEFAALAFDAVEVDQNESSTWAKGVMDRLERSLRKLEMVVGVADEDEIDGILRQLGRGLVAKDCLNVFDLVFLAGFF